ncbi:T9SS type A sorting domain-containing protein [bacterium]|nr:T9SS type A sorting domain-containing protein [bacterium]
MRRSALLTLLFLALATAPGLALELSAPSYALPPQVSVVDADAGHLRLAVDVPALAVEDVTLDGTTFQALSLPGGELGGEAGRAALPVFSQLIAVPAGMVARIRSTDAQERVLDGTRPAPLQPDDADRLAYDRAWYANGVAAKRPTAELGEAAAIRDLRVMPLTLRPVSFDPASGELRVAERLELEIEFVPDANAVIAPAPRMIPTSFDALYREAILNYDQIAGDRAGTAVGPGTWLLIYPEVAGVQTRLQALADWRAREGYNVIMVSTTTTGTSTTQIKNYIQGIYNTVDPPLEFVTLAGDATGTYTINCWSDNTSGYGGEGDHYYTTLEGGDVLADVNVGRLSYRSLTELDTIVNKILGYETNPPMGNTDWFTHGGVCGDPTSSTGIAAIYANQYVKAELLKAGFTAVDTIWSGNFPSQMTQTVNQGIAAFGYRGWYGMSGLTASAIQSFSNGSELPFAIIVTCDTGSFRSDATARSEAWLKAANGGGIGAVGTSTIHTHTRYNNTYFYGAWDGVINGSNHQFGPAHTRGKLELYKAYNLSQPNTVDTWSMWNNLMADPATDLYLGVPKALTVSHPTSVAVGASAVPVSVRSAGQPVAGARVALYRAGELRVVMDTPASGDVVLPLPAGLAAGDIMVTVTGHNLLAYLGDVTLGTQAVFPALANHTLDDDATGASFGNGNGELNPGERVELAFSLENLGTSTATGLSAELASDDPYVTVLTGAQAWADLPAGAEAWGPAPYLVALTADAPEAHVAELAITVHSGLQSWTSMLQLQVHSADLTYQSMTWSGGGSSLDPGESGTFSVNLQNLGSRAANAVSATLVSTSPWVTVTDGEGAYGNFFPGASGENTGDPFALSVSPDAIPGHLASFSLLLSYNDMSVDPVSFQLQVGNAAVGDPTGPDAYGYYAFESTDTAHPQAPVYDWVEIASNHGGAGTSVGLSDFGSEQDDTRIVTLPFTFRYYGQDFDEISICSNGWAAFGNTYLVNFRNYPLPASGTPQNLLAPFWDNLYQSGSDVVYHLVDAANHRYVVEWSRLRNDWNSTQETFEMILLDPAYYPTATGDGEIIFQYNQVSNVDSENGYATVGIQNGPRTDGLTISYWNQHPTSANNVAANRAIRFLTLDDALHASASVSPTSITAVVQQGTTQDRTVLVGNDGDAGSLLYYTLNTAALPAWLSATGATGTAQGGGNGAIQLHIDATALALGDYETTLAINHSGSNGPLVLALHLTVTGDATGADIAPGALVLGQNHPNPFNPATKIEFGLPTASDVRVTIFDAAGRAVRTLADGAFPAGWHNLRWDGTDAQGHALASGVYFYRLETAGERIQKKMLLLK